MILKTLAMKANVKMALSASCTAHSLREDRKIHHQDTKNTKGEKRGGKYP